MYRFLGFIILLIFMTGHLAAQVFPKEGSVLNYRIIGFSFPTFKKSTKYEIQIAAGYCNNVDSFEKKVIQTFYSASSKVIETVPAFGAQYTWRVTGTSKKSAPVQSSLFHFSTGRLPAVNVSAMRLRITNEAKKYKDAFVIVDDVNVMYNMQGDPVWYMPVMKQPDSTILSTRDVKLSPQGTITFVANNSICEVNYDGKILWQCPQKGIAKRKNATGYHHQCTRLQNGHFMALITLPQPSANNYRQYNATDNYSPQQIASLGALAEYDSTGKEVWSWESFNYFKNIHPQQLQSWFNDDNKQVRNTMDVHLNAFYFDEKAGVIYLSFRNVNTIVKVKYPEGDVLAVYGSHSQKNGGSLQKDLFCGQHSCNISMDGDLYLFNNNSCNPASPPSVLKIRLPATGNDTLEKTWEFPCSFSEKDSVGETYSTFPAGTDAAQNKNKVFFTTKFTSGGNVFELPDRSIFISISGNSGRALIVSPHQSILWSAVSERYAAATKKWIPNDPYRMSIIPSRKDLEQLIWNAEK